MEVHEAGGGINYTVEHTKKASEEELYTLLVDRLCRMIKSGKKCIRIYVQNYKSVISFTIYSKMIIFKIPSKITNG